MGAASQRQRNNHLRGRRSEASAGRSHQYPASQTPPIEGDGEGRTDSLDLRFLQVKKSRPQNEPQILTDLGFIFLLSLINNLCNYCVGVDPFNGISDTSPRFHIEDFSDTSLISKRSFLQYGKITHCAVLNNIFYYLV